MDRVTLLEHNTSWVREPKPFIGELRHLEAEEKALYQVLASDGIQENIRLEQELIRYGEVESAIGRILVQ